MSRAEPEYIVRANAMAWACWPHECPRVVLSTTGLVSCAALWLAYVDALPEVSA